MLVSGNTLQFKANKFRPLPTVSVICRTIKQYAMKTRTFCLLLSLFLCLPTPVKSQSGFLMPSNLDHVDIPFEYVNNFIIVNILFNRTLPLKMILHPGQI